MKHNLRNALIGVTVTSVLVLVAVLSYKLVSSRESNLGLLPQPDLSQAEPQVADKIRQLQAEVGQDPGSAEAWGNLAMTLHVHDLKSEAILCYKEAARLNPDEFKWPYYCATVLSDLASDEAFEWFEKSLVLRPDYVPLNVVYGRVLFDSGQGEKSSEAFDRVLRVDSTNSHGHVGLAKIAFARGDLQKSLEILKRALESNPDYREARGILAEVFRRQGHSDRAVEELNRARKLPQVTPIKDPLYEELLSQGISATSYRDRGLAYQTQGLIDEAIVEFEKAMKVRPDPEGFIHIGNLLRDQGRYADALKQFQTALRFNPNYYEALNQLGQTLFDLGQPNEAILWGEKTIRVNPNRPEAYLNLGQFYSQTGQNTRAIQVLRRGLEKTRSYPPVAMRLAWLLATSPEADLRDGDEALRLATFVCEKANVRNAESLDVLAVAYAETGQFSKARNAAREALQFANESQRQVLITSIKKRLKLFESNQPYLDEILPEGN